MLRSSGRRFLIVGLLTLLMFIPLFFAAEVVNSRKSYSEATINSVGEEWGGRQYVYGPQLVIPVETTVTRVATRPRVDPETGVVLTDPDTGEDLFERFRETVQEASAPVHLLPEAFDVDIATETQERRRGIFRVPVYTAQVEAGFDFDTAAAERLVGTDQRLLWEQAEVWFGVYDNRSLRGEARLEEGGEALALEPMSQRSGVKALVGDPRERGRYEMRLGMNGAQLMMVSPVGRTSRVTMVSDWPHPSFTGAFLPDGSTVTDKGFTAEWTIPHLARSMPQAGLEDPDEAARRTTFGVEYLTPNDFYQKAYRAARYGILFIALTFLTILLTERGTGRPAHPVQYILAGLAQTTFVLLMVSYAEHLGFAVAYALSSAAVIGLLTLFGVVALNLGRRALVLGAMLVVVYAVLYLILRSADYALLAGSTLAFLALALTMIVTRNEDWYGPDADKPKGRRPFLGTTSETPPPPATEG